MKKIVQNFDMKALGIYLAICFPLVVLAATMQFMFFLGMTFKIQFYIIPTVVVIVFSFFGARISKLRKEKNLKVFENKIMSIQRMGTIGLFTSSIGHDFNNILAAISSAFQVMKKKKSMENQDLVQSVDNMLVRGSQLVEQLLVISKGEKFEKEKVSLTPIMNDIEKFTTTLKESNIKLLIKGPKNSEINILGVQSQIYQIVLNLVTNGLQAMKETPEGILKIEWGHVMVKGIEKAFIKVSDNGKGLNKSEQINMFEPFSSKDDGNNLGLYIVKRATDNNKGEIHLLSTPDQGTTFTIYFEVYESVISNK